MFFILSLIIAYALGCAVVAIGGAVLVGLAGFLFVLEEIVRKLFRIFFQWITDKWKSFCGIFIRLFKFFKRKK